MENLINLLAGYGASQKVLKAFKEVPREEFVEKKEKQYAYEDKALPTAFGQTTTQPSLVAKTVQALGLTGCEKVLEVGTGTGFQTAILSHLTKHVYTIEKIKELGDIARKTLKKLGIENATVMVGDGCLGLQRFSPYDAIIVAAATKIIPQRLIKQLKEEGKMIIPLGGQDTQTLTLFKKQNGKLVEAEKIATVQFVPLVF